MTTHPDYLEKGYVYLPGFVPAVVTRAFVAKLQTDFARGGVALGSLKQQGPLLKREAIEVYGYHYAPMITFLWGMTPAISELVGHELLPTYSYFRVYQKGDICRVHMDRPSCEHSISLLLASSDDQPWPLEIGERHFDAPVQMADDDFGERSFHSVPMSPGDAVLYRGVNREHGRTMPNPNRWSAHLFMHWVDPDGPHAASAFDGQQVPAKVDFSTA